MIVSEREMYNCEMSTNTRAHHKTHGDTHRNWQWWLLRRLRSSVWFGWLVTTAAVTLTVLCVLIESIRFFIYIFCCFWRCRWFFLLLLFFFFFVFLPLREFASITEPHEMADDQLVAMRERKKSQILTSCVVFTLCVVGCDVSSIQASESFK